jgi:hypothetical protein
MEFLKQAWDGISNAFSGMSAGLSNMTSSFGNFFSGLFNGGGGSGTAIGAGTQPPSLSTPGFAPPQAGPLTQSPTAPSPVTQGPYPSPATNMHNTNSVPNQVMGVLNSGASQVLGRMGTAGQILAPIVDANLRVTDMTMRANQNGAISCAPPGQPMGPTPNLRGAFGGSCGAYQNRMDAARDAGAQAMIARGTNQAIQIGGQLALNGLYTPKGSGGAVGDALSRIFKR